MSKQDTSLETVGAEFLVLGHLLMHKIVSHKNYVNMPGYDILATIPKDHRSARIQVKSRWRTGAPHFLISNFESDFVVVVKLNRGSKDGKVTPTNPQYFVYPTEYITAKTSKGKWQKVFFKSLNEKEHENQWCLIANFLSRRS